MVYADVESGPKMVFVLFLDFVVLLIWPVFCICCWVQVEGAHDGVLAEDDAAISRILSLQVLCNPLPLALVITPSLCGTIVYRSEHVIFGGGA